jgi:hypothetical protein
VWSRPTGEKDDLEDLKSMPNGRNKVLAVTLLALMALSSVLGWMGREEEREKVGRDLFAVTETENVIRVVLVQPRDTVDLAYDGAGWTVNNAWKADVQMIKVLMATLRQVEPHRPVAAARADTVQAQLSRRGTRVTLTMVNGTQIIFIAGGNPGKSEAWFQKEGDPQAYFMVIPGYRVYVSGIFELGSEGWRDKRIFDFNWRNFKSLTASYPKEPTAEFIVEMKQRYFGIRGMNEVDTTKLNDYLDAVSLLVARRFVSTDTLADRAMRNGPVASIKIRDIADRNYSLELFAPLGESLEVYGRLADETRVTFDRQDVLEIVRKRRWFEPAKP